jgi:4-nitrophenyl phosphatase
MLSARAADPVREGLESSYLPAGGAFAATVAACVGRQPVVCGKPSPLAMELICAENKIDKGRTAMVGDTLYTDIAFGNACGVTSVLVLSGNTSAAAAEAAEGDEIPSLVLDSVADLLHAARHK